MENLIGRDRSAVLEFKAEVAVLRWPKETVFFAIYERALFFSLC